MNSFHRTTALLAFVALSTLAPSAGLAEVVLRELPPEQESRTRDIQTERERLDTAIGVTRETLGEAHRAVNRLTALDEAIHEARIAGDMDRFRRLSSEYTVEMTRLHRFILYAQEHLDAPQQARRFLHALESSQGEMHARLAATDEFLAGLPKNAKDPMVRMQRQHWERLRGRQAEVLAKYGDAISNFRSWLSGPMRVGELARHFNQMLSLFKNLHQVSLNLAEVEATMADLPGGDLDELGGWDIEAWDVDASADRSTQAGSTYDPASVRAYPLPNKERE